MEHGRLACPVGSEHHPVLMVEYLPVDVGKKPIAAADHRDAVEADRLASAQSGGIVHGFAKLITRPRRRRNVR